MQRGTRVMIMKDGFFFGSRGIIQAVCSNDPEYFIVNAFYDGKIIPLEKPIHISQLDEIK